MSWNIKYAIFNVSLIILQEVGYVDWMKYEDMLLNQIREKRLNVEHAEKIVKQAKAELASSERALQTFNEYLLEKLGEMKK